MLLVCLRMLDPSLIESIRLRYFDTLISNKESTVSKQIHVVNIDDEYIQKEGQFPFPRDRYSKIITDLYSRGAGMVVFNVFMPEPDRFGQDTKLAQTLKQYPVVIPHTGSEDPVRVKYEPFRPGVSIIGTGDVGIVYNSIQPNTRIINESAAGIGVVNTLPEIDGVTRRIPMVVRFEDKLYPSISLETLRVSSGDPSFQVKVTDNGIEAVRIPKFGKITTDAMGRIWVDWSSRPIEHSLSKLPKTFDNGIVIVGLTAKGFNNPVATSIGAVWPHYLQAAVLDTLISGTNITRPDWADGAEILTLFLAGVILLFLTRWTYVGIGSVIILSIAATYGSYFVYSNYLSLFDATALICSIILVSLHAYGVKFISEFLQKQQIKKQFGTYLSPDLVAQLQRQPELLKLGGEEKELSIMFTDVRGFTTISEHYGSDVQGLTKIMNRYMTAMTRKILENKGTLDKYIGDAQMAFWNAPVNNADHAKLAVKTAIEMMDSLDDFNKEITAEGIPAFGMGLGINTGVVVVGNMGSDQRFDYTCLGDAVNTASRLEGQSKNYGVLIVLGPETANLVKDDYDVFELDRIAVKGKTHGVKIYTLAKQGEPQNAFLYWYYEGEWDKALNIAKREMFTNKQMHKYYEMMVERCSNPPENWDGTYRATSK